jgi:hypothetical protein
MLEKLCLQHQEETVVELSNVDVTSGSRRPPASEIDEPPLLAKRENAYNCERYAVDSKHVPNANRKLWSLHRLVTYVTSGL